MILIYFMIAMEIYCGKKTINDPDRKTPSLLGKEGVL